MNHLECLAKEHFSELYILGYSGDNDNHINTAIKNNTNIETVYYYANPTVVRCQDANYLRRVGNRFRNGVDSFDFSSDSPFILLSWDDFWDSIKKPINS